jgi:uroporphyrinogen decarboxylase
VELAHRELEEKPECFRIAGFGELYFERMFQMRGFENILMDMITEKRFVEGLMDRITELNLAFLEVNASLPVDALMTSDDWGDQRGIIVGPERWRELFKPRVAKVWAAAHAHGKIVIHHTCGNVSDIIPDLIEIGLNVLESVQPEAMDVCGLKKGYGKDLTFWGGLGSQSIIPFGTPEEIRAQVSRLCRALGKEGGYILAPAKPLQPETPTENAVEAFLDQED